MKFGKYLQENQIFQWKKYYVHYKAIKKFIAMAEMHVDKGLSDEDEKYFIDKVEQNVRRIEEWFLEVRNGCFERFEHVQNTLPKQIKAHLPCISEFTSFQQYTTRRNIDKDRKSKKKSKKSKRKRHKSKGRSRKDKHKSKGTKADNQSITSSSTTSAKGTGTTGTNVSTAPASTEEHEEDEEVVSQEIVSVKDRVTIIDIQHNDEEQQVDYDEDEADLESVSTPVSMSDVEDELSDDEHKYEYNLDDSNSFNEKYLVKNIDGELVQPPSTLFIENAVFSHLPPGAHRECLSILLTLGKLKLFAWQNSEGVRKIIKKYDKRFSKTLTSTLWPKIKLNEFVQETKNDSYIAQVAAVLCTRTIPFGHLDANDLREKGVNLKQMAESIQMLENVTDERDLKEIVPMNVEPRSYMANERTFLKWMRMAALTVLVGMIILSMGHEKVTGVLMIILSIFVLLRSYHEYYKRNEVLVNRIQYDWIDNLGPVLLMLSLMLPMTTYLVYLILFGSTTNMFHK
eukprot:222376_1